MGTVEANGATLYYEMHGQGEPLVMIQGCGGDITLWETQIEPLSKHFQLILFDNRGMGRSQGSPGNYTTKMLAQDTVALMEQLEIRSAHVLGWSMGGMIAQELAIAHPKLVNKLILSASASKFPDSSVFIFNAFVEMMRRGEYESLAKWQMTLCFSHQFFSDAQVVAETLESFINPSYPLALEGFTSQISALFSHDRRGQLQAIQCPTLVLGAEEDQFFPIPVVHETAADISGAKSQILPGSHLYFVEYPEEVSESTIAFLKA